VCCDRVKRPLRSRLAAAVKVPAGHHLMTLLGQPAKSPQQEPRCDPREAGVGTLSTEPQGAVRARLRRSRRDGSSRDRGPHSPPQLGRASPRRPRDRRRVGQDLRRGPSGRQSTSRSSPLTSRTSTAAQHDHARVVRPRGAHDGRVELVVLVAQQIRRRAAGCDRLRIGPEVVRRQLLEPRDPIRRGRYEQLEHVAPVLAGCGGMLADRQP
jgi:hypothetical protein